MFMSSFLSCCPLQTDIKKCGERESVRERARESERERAMSQLYFT